MTQGNIMSEEKLTAAQREKAVRAARITSGWD